MTFPTGDTAGKKEEGFSFELRVLGSPLIEPVGTGLVIRVVEAGVDATMNGGELVGWSLGIVFEDVVFYRFGNTDHFFALGHDRGVEVHGVEAMHGCHETRARTFRQLFPSEIAEPGGDARAEVEYVGFELKEKFLEAGDEGERKKRLFMNREAVMNGTLRGQFLDKASSIGEDVGLMTLRCEIGPELQGAALDAAGI